MIDGAANNNVFGLASSGNNGGQAGAQPVSMETIEQIQVSVAPFDVRQSGFTGGATNAITKSGTNKFHGSAYYYGYNQDLIGIKYPYLDGTGYAPKYQKQTQYNMGVTLGGGFYQFTGAYAYKSYSDCCATGDTNYLKNLCYIF